MGKRKRKTKIISLVILVVSILSIVVGFFIQGIPVNPSYVYTDNKIVVRSWQNYYEDIIAIMVLIIILFTMIEIVILIIHKIKNKDKIFSNIALVVGTLLLSIIALGFSDILVIGLWSEDDYSPQCYKFTDNQHTIVIEEKSYLLYGGATIYQIKDDTQATIIGTISTDDGGRNNGNYEIQWSNDSAEITYNTCNSNNDKQIVTVTFE